MHEFKPRFGISKLTNEDDDEYETRLREDIDRSNMLIMGSGCARPTTFAYPFGKYNKHAREILVNMDFRALLTCNELVTTITQGDPETLHQLGRFNRDGHYSTGHVIDLISRNK
jgi:peptidoglycan/xylan/chitin deacetylase (PgdA/CDA1 family)